ncbi:RNA-binding protein 39-like [Symsagittifera roscoffensis]|uniref:RNA-binding protein 39-like n=1 Tax=Symsagittifera roscoffensis TaxID=84072 RepID=UPI00307C0D4B
MDDDFDVERLLDEAFSGDKKNGDVKKGEKKRTKKRSSSRDRNRDRKGSRDRSKRSRSGKKSPKRRSRSRERRSPRRDKIVPKSSKHERDRSPRRRSRTPPKYDPRIYDPKGRAISKSPSRRRRSRSPSPWRRKPDVIQLTQEDRDVRTVFCMQLAANITPRDLEKAFACVGTVQDVRLIGDKHGRRSKGIAYVEFLEIESVQKAIGMTGKKVLGVPIIVQPSQAEKNRVINQSQTFVGGTGTSVFGSMTGPTRLFVGSLHENITETMLENLFKPYGNLEKIELVRDPESGTSKGYAFATFNDSECGKKAMEQLNGFELAGRPMKVNAVIARQEVANPMHSLDTEDAERTGVELGQTGRLGLMAKLAEGTGFKIPKSAEAALTMREKQIQAQLDASKAAATAAGHFNSTPSGGGSSSGPGTPNSNFNSSSSSANPHEGKSQCFLLQNMFNPQLEHQPGWDEEIRDDVLEALAPHGGAVHLYIDRQNPLGNIYIKAPELKNAESAIKSLNGRYFSGRQVKAAYIPLANYSKIFPQSVNATDTLLIKRKSSFR